MEAFIEAGSASGLPYNEDYNGVQQDGMGRGQFTIRKGRRHTAADAYLRPAVVRGNVTLHTQAHVTRVVIEGTRAVGIEYARSGNVTKVRARREVILSAGTFTAEQLNEMGLINRMAANADELAALEKEFVEDLKALDPLAVKLTKDTHRAVQRASMDEALITAKQLNSLLMASGKIDEAAERYAKEKADRRGR